MRPCSERAAERATADRFAERLGAKVGRPDRVCLSDDGRAARVIATNGHRQTESQKERNKTEERRLENTERLTKDLGVRAEAMAEQHSREGRSEHDPKEQERELKATQAVQHELTSLLAADRSTARGIICHEPDGNW